VVTTAIPPCLFLERVFQSFRTQIRTQPAQPPVQNNSRVSISTPQFRLHPHHLHTPTKYLASSNVLVHGYETQKVNLHAAQPPRTLRQAIFTPEGSPPGNPLAPSHLQSVGSSPIIPHLLGQPPFQTRLLPRHQRRKLPTTITIP